MANSSRKSNRTAGSTPNRNNKKANLNTSQELRQADLTTMLQRRETNAAPPPQASGPPSPRPSGEEEPPADPSPPPVAARTSTEVVQDGWLDSSDEDDASAQVADSSSGAQPDTPRGAQRTVTGNTVSPPSVRFQPGPATTRILPGPNRPSPRNPYARTGPQAG